MGARAEVGSLLQRYLNAQSLLSMTKGYRANVRRFNFDSSRNRTMSYERVRFLAGDAVRPAGVFPTLTFHHVTRYANQGAGMLMNDPDLARYLSAYEGPLRKGEGTMISADSDEIFDSARRAHLHDAGPLSAEQALINRCLAPQASVRTISTLLQDIESMRAEPWFTPALSTRLHNLALQLLATRLPFAPRVFESALGVAEGMRATSTPLDTSSVALIHLLHARHSGGDPDQLISRLREHRNLPQPQPSDPAVSGQPPVDPLCEAMASPDYFYAVASGLGDAGFLRWVDFAKEMLGTPFPTRLAALHLRESSVRAACGGVGTSDTEHRALALSSLASVLSERSDAEGDRAHRNLWRLKHASPQMVWAEDIAVSALARFTGMQAYSIYRDIAAAWVSGTPPPGVARAAIRCIRQGLPEDSTPHALGDSPGQRAANLELRRALEERVAEVAEVAGHIRPGG